MSKPFVAHFTVQGGKIEWRNENYLNVNLPRLEGMQGVLTVKKKWNKRSLNQNSYFWLCLEVIAEYTGHTSEELHVIYKGLYSPKKEIKLLNKKSYMIPKGTSELTKGEFAELMLNIQADAGSMGITLPDPNDYKMEMDTPKLLN